MSKKRLQYAVWKEDKYFVAQCLNIDISSFGKTKKEAIDNLDEAIDLYLEDHKKPLIIKIQRVEIVPGKFQNA